MWNSRTAFRREVDMGREVSLTLSPGPAVCCADSTAEKIFIAAMFYNNAPVLPYWTTEITKIIHYLGPVSPSHNPYTYAYSRFVLKRYPQDNVFVSIVESTAPTPRPPSSSPSTRPSRP
jgi:hypothetical protein